jgi:L-threonylcarbamoyladenylate synthase
MTIKNKERLLLRAKTNLQQGGILIVPTIRWYMICCLASNDLGIMEIFRAKRRLLSKQPLFIIPSADSVSNYFHVNISAQRLIDFFWPGELTLQLRWKSKSIDYSAYSNEDALVCCPSGIFGEIVAFIEEPLAATSVNVIDESKPDDYGPAISVFEINEFIRETGIVIKQIIDNGICPSYSHTTILDCRNMDSAPILIREGFVHKKAIYSALSNERS